MKRSSPHASGIFGLWRRLGLGFVGIAPSLVPSAVPLSLSGVRRGYHSSPGHPSALDLPCGDPQGTRIGLSDGIEVPEGRCGPKARTHAPPSPIPPSPEARMHPRLWCGRAGTMARGQGSGDKVFCGWVGKGLLSGTSPSPSSSSGLIRGSATPLLCSAEVATPRVSRLLNPFTGCPMQQIPGSSPRMTMGVG
ncbi:hypothetical protein SAMN05428936_10769 [Pelagibacterium halotolerans]|nr:hypothetical protein SAMN05428936_10769 [Pelagibacterium halotolerans]